MKLRHTRSLIALATVVAVATGCGSSSSGSGDTGTPASDASPAASADAPAADASGTLNIWLMDGSQPQSVLDTMNTAWTAMHPNVKVNVELQKWGGIQDKLTAGLGSDSTPDIAEIGNTLTAKFADAGLLADLTDNAAALGEANWLPGLKASGELDGARYGIPYYGGVRGVIYNKTQFAAAGVEVPTSIEEMAQVAAKLQAKNSGVDGYSAFYFPGKFWYGALPFVWATGGEIAVKDGDSWKGALDSAESQEGLTILKDMVDKYSKAPKDGDETKNYTAFETGKVGMVIDSWWAPGAIVKEKPELADATGVFALPGVEAGSTAPVFFGGSDLAVSEKSSNKDLAVEWMTMYLSPEMQTQLAKEGGVIPNQVAAFAGHEGNPFLPAFDKAAENSKFTPVTPTWGNVESSSILQDMLVKIMTGKSSVADATKAASEQITAALNG